MVSLRSARIEGLKQAGERSKERPVRVQRKLTNVTDFALLQVIGAGAFGIVRLCQKKDTNEVFALKQMSKAEMIRKNKVCHVLNEKDALRKADNVWVIGLHCTFQDDNFLYMVMDYLPGGDLMTHLQRKGKFSEAETRFYIGELVQAVDYIHTVLGIIHRDIKPDNVVLDTRGHIRVVDFGLSVPEAAAEPAAEDARPTLLGTRQSGAAKATGQLTRVQMRSLVGTPDYAAPEAYLRGPCSRESDWWSVGVIAYEMLFGRTPFADEKHDPRVIAVRVQRWRQFLRLPYQPNVGGPARMLVTGLLCDAQDRLTADEIRAHPFFQDLNFDTLRSMEPPIKPLVLGPLDTSNFDDFSSMDLQIGCVPPGQVEEQSTFQSHGYHCEQNHSRYLSEEPDDARASSDRTPESTGWQSSEALERPQPLLHRLADLLSAPALLICSSLLRRAEGCPQPKVAGGQ